MKSTARIGAPSAVTQAALGHVPPGLSHSLQCKPGSVGVENIVSVHESSAASVLITRGVSIRPSLVVSSPSSSRRLRTATSMRWRLALLLSASSSSVEDSHWQRLLDATMLLSRPQRCVALAMPRFLGSQWFYRENNEIHRKFLTNNGGAPRLFGLAEVSLEKGGGSEGKNSFFFVSKILILLYSV